MRMPYFVMLSYFAISDHKVIFASISVDNAFEHFYLMLNYVR